MVLKEKIKSKNLFLLIGSLLFLCVSSYTIYNYMQSYNSKTQEENQIDSYINKDSTNDVETADNLASDETNEHREVNYSFVIEIPEISLKKGIYGIIQEFNTVSKNIQLLNESDMPDIENGNVILASHNGSSSISFFNKLDRLNTDSIIYIYQSGIKYEYRLNNSYEIEKNGTAIIKRDLNKSTLTLITCKRNSKDKQMVYIAYLINKTEY